MPLEKQGHYPTPPTASYGAGPEKGGPPGYAPGNAQQQPFQAYPQSQPPIYSGSSRPPPDGRRLLHVYPQGMRHRNVQIMDSDKTTLLYTIESNSGSIFSSKPHMRIRNGITGAEVGSVTFHGMSSSMDLVIHGREMSFDRPSIFTTTQEFHSLASGQVLKWKKDGMWSGGDLKCVNERGELYALFELSVWALSKDGKFELGPAVQGPLMDEVIVSGVAAMEKHRRARNSSAAGAGGGAGA